MLAPLNYLVGECRHIKVTQANKTKNKPWHLDDVHENALNMIKATITQDFSLAYPDYTHGFEI
jgi:hypothetical protein